MCQCLAWRRSRVQNQARTEVGSKKKSMKTGVQSSKLDVFGLTEVKNSKPGENQSLKLDEGKVGKGLL